MNEGLYEKISGTVKAVAREASTRWNGMMDADDIEQELWLYILESPAVQDWLSEHTAGECKAPLNRKANSICSKERISYDLFTGNWEYNVAEAKELLNKLVTGDPMSSDESVDLELALSDLQEENPQHFEVIHNIYWELKEYETGSERVRKTRAHEKLVQIMNRKRSQRELDRTEGPGTKPTVTEGEY